MILLRSEISESSPGALPFAFDDDDDDDDAALACLRPLRITDQRGEEERALSDNSLLFLPLITLLMLEMYFGFFLRRVTDD